jgi:nitronate monooxygenase
VKIDYAFLLLLHLCFLGSGLELVIESCKAGIVGTFLALNQRTSEAFENWLIEIQTRLAD